jgi:hypothetical protein
MQFDNFVIECLDIQHGKKLREFFKSKGIATSYWNFNSCKSNNGNSRYYGIINGDFTNYSDDNITAYDKVEVITLEEAITRFSGEVKEPEFIFGI